MRSQSQILLVFPFFIVLSLLSHSLWDRLISSFPFTKLQSSILSSIKELVLVWTEDREVFESSFQRFEIEGIVLFTNTVLLVLILTVNGILLNKDDFIWMVLFILICLRNLGIMIRWCMKKNSGIMLKRRLIMMR